MEYTTTQLLFRNWYSGVDLPEEEARFELKARGWLPILQSLVVSIAVPFILIERLIVALDFGDPWETANARTMAFSVLFSIWLLSPVVLVVLFAAWLYGVATGVPIPAWPVAIPAVAFIALGLLFWTTSGRWV